MKFKLDNHIHGQMFKVPPSFAHHYATLKKKNILNDIIYLLKAHMEQLLLFLLMLSFKKHFFLIFWGDVLLSSRVEPILRRG